MSDTRTQSQMALAEITVTYERLYLELLTVDAAIAEAARAFHADGISMRMGDRSALIARQKRLALELHQLRILRNDQKTKAMTLKSQSFVSVLVQRCIDAGRTDLVDDARADANQALADAGLLDAYRLKI